MCERTDVHVYVCVCVSAGMSMIEGVHLLYLFLNIFLTANMLSTPLPAASDLRLFCKSTFHRIIRALKLPTLVHLSFTESDLFTV